MPKKVRILLHSNVDLMNYQVVCYPENQSYGFVLGYAVQQQRVVFKLGALLEVSGDLGD